MKLRNLLFCLCSIVTLTSSAIEPVAQLFIAMPDSLVPSIEINRRKDLIDLMHAGQKAEIVTKLGGQIGADSVEGEGSTFWFTIPYRTCGKPR